VCALARRPSVQARVRILATIGTYYDVVHLVGGVTTGSVCVNGSRLRTNLAPGHEH
jgi:hypothetical protein